MGGLTAAHGDFHEHQVASRPWPSLSPAAVGTGVAFSQSASEAQAKATTTEKVKTISARQWSRMKRQWSKQTVKWTSCNKQADDQISPRRPQELDLHRVLHDLVKTSIFRPLSFFIFRPT